MTAADPLVVICRDPRDSARARVRLSALSGFAFDGCSHAGRSTFARHMLVAFVAPAAIHDGELRRLASHGIAPDRMKVAIPRTHNQMVYPMLERMAAANRIAQLAPIPRRRVRLDAPAIPTRPVAPHDEAVPGHRCPVPEIIDVVAIRTRTGLSRTDFAHRFGFDPATVYQWEIGRRAPRTASRERLARIE